MAVQNKLAGLKGNEDRLVEYTTSNNEKIKLTPRMAREFLVSGGGEVTDQEIIMFLNLCKYQRLNPFLREAYLIKYGNAPATLVVGKEVFTKRARRNKDYAGQQAGIVVLKQDGSMESRIGMLKLPEEELVGGWAKVFIENFKEPVEITVPLDEYIGRKKDGDINSQWRGKPATMIRKVALVQALREAFPEDFTGMYSQEEVDTGDLLLDETPIDESQIVNAQSEPEALPEEIPSDPFAG